MFAVSVLRPRVRKPTYKHHWHRAGVLHPSALHRMLATVSSEVGEWRRRLRDRRALAAMSDRSLRDIGLTRYDALHEADKPFWRE